MGLMRLQLDAMGGVVAGGIDGRLASLEQSFQRSDERNGARLSASCSSSLPATRSGLMALDAALAKLGTDLAENTERIIREIRVNGR